MIQMQSLRYFHQNDNGGDGDEKGHENDDGDYDDNVRTL